MRLRDRLFVSMYSLHRSLDHSMIGLIQIFPSCLPEGGSFDRRLLSAWRIPLTNPITAVRFTAFNSLRGIVGLMNVRFPAFSPLVSNLISPDAPFVNS